MAFLQKVFRIMDVVVIFKTDLTLFYYFISMLKNRRSIFASANIMIAKRDYFFVCLTIG